MITSYFYFFINLSVTYLFQIWNHPDVLYYFLKKRSICEDVDLDLEETTGAAATPLAAGGVVPPGRGAPAKRGRGSRGPRNPPGPKRERKVNLAFIVFYNV